MNNQEILQASFSSYLQGKEIKKAKEEGEAERRRTITETMWTHFGKQKKGDFSWSNLRKHINEIGGRGAEQLFHDWQKIEWENGDKNKLFWKLLNEQNPFTR